MKTEKKQRKKKTTWWLTRKDMAVTKFYSLFSTMPVIKIEKLLQVVSYMIFKYHVIFFLFLKYLKKKKKSHTAQSYFPNAYTFE